MITNLAGICIRFLKLVGTQFAQFNETTKWQDILRRYLGDIAKKQIYLKIRPWQVSVFNKCVLTTLNIYQCSSILSYTFLRHVMLLHVFTTRTVKKKQVMV